MGVSQLARWLAGLDPDRLADILVRRPHAWTAPSPRNLLELADRLSERADVAAAFRQLCQPAVQVLEAAQALLPTAAGGVPLAALAELLGRTPDDPDLLATLDVLAQRALAWRAGDRIQLAGPLHSAFPFPLGLGRPAAALLESRPMDELRRIAGTLNRPPGRSKREAVTAIATWLADPDHVRALHSSAPPATRGMLAQVAVEGPLVTGAGWLPPEVTWAIDRGLLISDGWQTAEMPREVVLTLRGPDWRAPFTPRPPMPPRRAIDADVVAREAAAAASAALDAVGAVLEAAPVPLLKSGGVGAREQRRLARAGGGDEDAVRLWLEIARGAGLLGVSGNEALATAEYDEWCAAAPGPGFARLVAAWERLPAVPTLPTAALTRDTTSEPAAALRSVLLRAVADLDGAVPANGAGLAALVEWHAPLAVSGVDQPARAVAAHWDEARRLGLVAFGALSPLGRALLSGDVAATAGPLLTGATDRAVFQADLTAVVAGSPSVELARLLDSCADRESRGAASVWRFSPASVRRALDAGASAGELVARLRAAGSVPQALEYLIGDVARRHGVLRVRAVGCVLRSSDAALLAEVAANRRLAGLGLTPLAATVLASTAGPAETLAALRAAGYAPTGEDTTGAQVIELAPRRRALATGQPPALPPERSAPYLVAGQFTATKWVPQQSARTGDPRALAVSLLSAPLPDAGSGPAPLPARDGPQETIARAAPQLSPTQVRLLAYALDHQLPVHIEYVNAGGRPSSRVIEPLELDDGYLLRAWCQLRGDERVFALARIGSVART